jgi:hypothetical protein
MKNYLFNYTYYSYEEWGRGYIGSRGSHKPPDQDPYMGSFHDKTFNPAVKIILSIHNTREEAYYAESLLHDLFQVDLNPHFVNIHRCHSGFWFLDHSSKAKSYWDYVKKTNPAALDTRIQQMVAAGNDWRRDNKDRMLKNARRASLRAKETFLQLPTKERKEKMTKMAETRSKIIAENPTRDWNRYRVISKPVKVTQPDGVQMCFYSKKECAKYYNVSLTCINNLLGGRRSYKLRGFLVCPITISH